MPKLIALRIVVGVDLIKVEIIGLDQQDAGNFRRRYADLPLDLCELTSTF